MTNPFLRRNFCGTSCYCKGICFYMVTCVCVCVQAHTWGDGGRVPMYNFHHGGSGIELTPSSLVASTISCLARDLASPAFVSGLYKTSDVLISMGNLITIMTSELSQWCVIVNWSIFMMIPLGNQIFLQRTESKAFEKCEHPSVFLR